MIQKNSPPTRRGSLRSTPSHTNNVSMQSPSIRSTSSFSNIRRNITRTSSNSPANSRSSSPLRSVSSISDHFHAPRRFNTIRRTNSQTYNTKSEHSTYTGTITVAIRPKPTSNPSDVSTSSWLVTDEKTIAHDDVGEFKFDHVFNSFVSNLEIYQVINRPMIDKLFQGFNSTIFAYGMTGSGKTYTMMGCPEREQKDGLIPLSVSYLFTKIMEETLDGDKKFEIVLSYLEIYNEKIYDLLGDENNNNNNNNGTLAFGTPTRNNNNICFQNELKIRDDSKYGVRVIGLTEKRCESSEELMNWIIKGDKIRKTAETDFNARSSRSHAIVLIRLTTSDMKDGTSISSTLSLCDLAGSERATGQQERRKEGAFINKSLLALGTVISKLSTESNKNRSPTLPSPPLSSSSSSTSINSSVPGHIPYRDSKLTRLLQPALSGDSIVTTICTIDTKNESSAETLNTLRFASRAKNISLHVNRKPLVHTGEDSDDKNYKIMQLTKKLQEQQQLISTLRQDDKSLNKVSSSVYDHMPGTTSGNLIDPTIALIYAENKVLKHKLTNCEKLLDKDTVELDDPEIIEIVEMLPYEVGSLLETKIQGLQSQLRQYKEYTNELESKIRDFENANKGTSRQYPNKGSPSISNSNKENIIQDKENQILELQKMLNRKDKMIDALQSVRRLRDRALKPISSANN
ncbi:Kip2p NDAI_0E02090 [Naumovozyma dairenensis CBS 421]|uniref:Kinesin-like protein n=1 Tax=Naumovozyma dairenensis (strain ATCC 10597 / BCRC 20456 / CBS 421 / NBRC 0211 / NRRL Y-12639) TaxID=1071378 RepID=G0WBA5_NAUDC|nr:hypothetical protein NDAI_0E02090 [Naumovozyma dairenensis CBS 421]CCD25025.1 hypothetical protein NDAI_0E02090 [Naumovozyma dairenensis CBS 421]